MENYRKFKDCKVEFPDGVIGVIGPNGVGKSSLIEAISWAMYGNEKMIVRTNKEGIKNASAGPNDECRVLLEFILDEDEYRLERRIRGKDSKVDAMLMVNGSLQARGDRPVTEAIIKRLGMDYKAFFISVFARQKDLSALSDLNPSERKKLILRMLDIDVLDVVVKKISDDYNDLKKDKERAQALLVTQEGHSKKEVLSQEIKTLRSESDSYDKDLVAARERLRKREREIEEARKEKERVQRIENEHRKAGESVSILKGKVASFESSLQGIERDIASLNERASTLDDLKAASEEYERLLKQKESMEEQRPQHEQKKMLASRLSKTEEEREKNDSLIRKSEAELAPLGKSPESLLIVENNLKELEEKSAGLREETRFVDGEIKRLREEIEKMDLKQEEISKLGPDSSCPTCGRRLEGYHEHLLDKIAREHNEKAEICVKQSQRKQEMDEEIDRVNQRINVLNARKKKLKQECEEAIKIGTRISGLKEKQIDLESDSHSLQESRGVLIHVKFDERSYQECKTSIARLKPQAEKYRDFSADMKRLPDLHMKKEGEMSLLTAAQKELVERERAMDSIGFKVEMMTEIEEWYENLLHLKESDSNEVTQKEAYVKSTADRMNDKERQFQDILDYENRISEINKNIEETSMLATIMKSFRISVMSRIVPTLSEISSQLFVEMTDSKYSGMELDEETYDIRIFDGGQKYPVNRFSGGEGDLANLSLRLAISRVIADRSGSSVNFLILDEIFGSQDQVRKRNIMGTLNQLAKQFGQIVLITHIDDIKDFMGHVILIEEREDGSSNLVVET